MAKIWKTFDKDPDAVKPYVVDWANGGPNNAGTLDIGYLQGDTILTSTWIVPSGITKDSDSNTTTAATIWLSGGTDGEPYELTSAIVTVAGITDHRTILINVLEQ